MKLASFEIGGVQSYGAITAQGVVDLGRRFGARAASLRELIAIGGIDEARALAGSAAADHPLDAIRFRPVIPNPDKILCVGLNYEEHRVETGREKTENPAIFIRVPDSQTGHGQPMVRPRESQSFDYEGEIALIIGRTGRRIPQAEAYDYIAGYSCYNDGSVRDWQRHTVQWTAGKNFTATGAFGPWMVTADEIPPGTRMTLSTRLNGRELQHADTDMMIFKIPALIAYLSTITTLLPGDVIVTGTPGGVGARRNPPVYMNPGDTVEVEIDKVGILSNPITSD
jgi:2-keto-4-pentenoate hydratase/2-oxohepta-3-ene-1,7-dioic acid hydratase in catechol pathway